MHALLYLLPNLTRIMKYLLFNWQIFLIILLADFFDIVGTIRRSVTLGVQKLDVGTISRSVH